MLNMLGNAVRGTGNMTLPATVILGSVLGHIVISPLLIFGWGPLPALGPAGAGWGLTVSFGVGGLVLLAYLRSPRSLATLVFRGVSLQWALFAEILKVGVPGLVNVIITNLSVVLLTGIAGHLGRETAIGYAMGARLEYILIPLGLGFGTAINAMVGTNWGAKQYGRARRIAWTGAATVAGTCAVIGLVVAVFPNLWMGLFSTDEAIVRLSAAYLLIVGPIYGCYGLGMGLFSATQGFGSVVATVTANAVRLSVSAGGGLIAISWFGLGPTGFFAAIALGFITYAALSALAVLRVKSPEPAPVARRQANTLFAFTRLVTSRWAAYARQRRRWAAICDLHALDDRMLRDIGLGRSEVDPRPAHATNSPSHPTSNGDMSHVPVTSIHFAGR
jgi:Na+-driven multidrug efflux pump/uncharacterized protein YjiS (DUF1127 family)